MLQATYVDKFSPISLMEREKKKKRVAFEESTYDPADLFPLKVGN